MKPIRIAAAALAVTPDATARTITGTITVFDTLAPSHGLILAPGCLVPREPIKRVKMLVDHVMSQPVGYMTEFAQGAADATATFHIPEGEAGDKALDDAAKGLRDGLSVGFLATKYEFDRDYNLIVKEAELYEVSLCAIPAFQDAQVESVAAALAATTTEGNTMTPEEIAAAAALAAQQPAPAADAAPAAAPAAPAAELQQSGHRQAPAPAMHTTPRPKSLSMVAREVAAAVATGDAAAIRLALADVLPADDAGEGWLRDSWIGEVWQAARTDRPWIDAFGTPGQLTSMKIKGFRWGTRPKPAKWAGNKTDVPTNKPKTEPWESTAERWAGGWDIDRIFVDLGEAGFLESFWAAAMAEYKQDSNTDIGAQTIAAATDKGAAATALDAIKLVARDLRSIGATASTIFLADDVYDEYADLTQDQVPHWLANVIGGVNIADGTADVGTLKIASNEDLAAGVVIGLDKRAAQVREKTPIKLQAFDVAKGGIDLGFFSYGGLAVYDPRAIVKRTVAGV